MQKLILMIMSLLCAISLQAKPITLTWATEATYPPFASVDSRGNMVGLDIDLAHAICKKLNTTTQSVRCQFVNAPFDSLIPGLQMGKYDVIWGGMASTKARQKVVNFTHVYYTNAIKFVAPKKHPLTLTQAGLKGKTIGVQQGNTMQAYLQGTYGDAITVKAYASIQDAFMDLKIGRIDAVLSDAPVIQTWLNKKACHKKSCTPNSTQYAYTGATVVSKKYFGAGNGNAIAVNKHNNQLLAQLNHAINDLQKNGQLQKIITKWIH